MGIDPRESCGKAFSRTSALKERVGIGEKKCGRRELPLKRCAVAGTVEAHDRRFIPVNAHEALPVEVFGRDGEPAALDIGGGGREDTAREREKSKAPGAGTKRIRPDGFEENIRAGEASGTDDLKLKVFFFTKRSDGRKDRADRNDGMRMGPLSGVLSDPKAFIPARMRATRVSSAMPSGVSAMPRGDASKSLRP